MQGDSLPILTLRKETLSAPIPAATSWLLADCMEFRGRQELWTTRKPAVLRALCERAIIQSVESSNRIEGVTVAPGRLAPIVRGNVRPKDRSEEELLGYRRALDWIFSRRRVVPIDGRTICKLHEMSQHGASDAGQFKRRDNEIIEQLPQGGTRVRFRPTPAKLAPRAIAALCGAVDNESIAGGSAKLLSIATFVFDFLCIHPFRDGNGRAARLLATLLMEQHGFLVSRYVSIERLIEESKQEYYRILGACSVNWSSGKNAIVPWWNYFLGVTRRAYRELQEQVEAAANRASKTELVRMAVERQIGEFALADLRRELAEVSPQMIAKVLQDLRAEGKVRLIGRGRGATWINR
jgi:Fic family protein